MRSASKLSVDEKIALCGQLYQGGMSSRDIAAATGIGKSSVPGYVKAAGIELDGNSRIAAKMTGKPGARKGAIHTPEARAKISKARQGKPTTSGQVRTAEQKARMSEAQRKLGKQRKIIRSQPALFRRTPMPKLTAAERAIRRSVRSSFKRMLRRVLTMARVRKDARAEGLLGYTKTQLRSHLESQFRRGMSWENRSSFEIDHIVPVADFFRRGIHDPSVINALSNLQPLTPEENRAKRDRIITDSGAQLGIQVLV